MNVRERKPNRKKIFSGVVTKHFLTSPNSLTNILIPKELLETPAHAYITHVTRYPVEKILVYGTWKYIIISYKKEIALVVTGMTVYGVSVSKPRSLTSQDYHNAPISESKASSFVRGGYHFVSV